MIRQSTPPLAVMGILALIAKFENDIRRERQMDGIAKARAQGVKFGRKRDVTPERAAKSLREAGSTVPEIKRRTGLSKASIYKVLAQ
jgi:DNA invertase Pin-like site-specific DNA recombinase